MGVGFGQHHDMLRTIVAENLRALMAAHPDLDTLEKVTARGGGSNGTLDRMRRGASSCRLDAIADVARVFCIEPWQLLVPRLDPHNLPHLDMDTNHAQELRAELENIAARILKK
jgi:hypothetical protein